MKSFTFVLNVPSGKMVFADSLPGFETLGDFDVNTVEGKMKQTMAMAEIGCAHAYVGNSCPSIYRVNFKKFIVAEVGWTKKTGRKLPGPGKDVGSITTDLWWYSFADLQEFVRRSKRDPAKYQQMKVTPVSTNLPTILKPRPKTIKQASAMQQSLGLVTPSPKKTICEPTSR